MSEKSPHLSRISRQLVVFHLFRNCREVSFREITDMLPVSRKTAGRDIRLLRQAGVLQIRYSRRQEAYIPVCRDFTAPEWPENQTKKRYLEKIRRLCTLMVQLEGADNPVEWYRAQYPGLSERTRERDFRELGKIGYRIGFRPLRNPDEDWDPHYEPGWYCDFPAGAYDIVF